MTENNLFPIPTLEALVREASALTSRYPVAGIHAGANFGKDVVSAEFTDAGFLYVAFSTKLKEACIPIFGLSEDQAFSDELKEIVVPHLGLTPREVFQRFGTQVCRHGIGEDIWVQSALRNVVDSLSRAEAAGVPYRGILFQDIRFPNEAKLARLLGGKIIHIQRPVEKKESRGSWHRPTDRTHASEDVNAISVLDGEPVINNSGTLNDLKRRSKEELASVISSHAKAAAPPMANPMSPGMQ